MLADSAHIQEKDAEFLARRDKERVPPLYGMRDATRALELMVGVPYDKPFDVVPGMRATFIDAGHILGSASVVLDVHRGRRDASGSSSPATSAARAADHPRPEASDGGAMS